MKILLLLLSCLPCCAQFASISDQPFLGRLPTASGYTDPSGANALYAWWVSSDLSVGIGLNTNSWNDRIAAKKIWAYDTTVTNSGSGVDLQQSGDRTMSLTNETALTAGTNQTLCIITYPRIITDGIYPRLLYGPWDLGDSTQNNAATHGGIVFEKTGAMDWGTAFTGGPQIATIPAVSNLYDFVLVQSNSTAYFYTNGTLSTSFSRTPPANGYPWKFLGDETSAARAYVGLIREVLVWSNNLSFLQVSNVHRYRTNTYGL